MFKLHSQLEKDCFHVLDLSLCRLLLMNDANYPWFILVPMRESVTELHKLSKSDQAEFLAESSALSEAMEDVFKPDKMNIAALGNIVPQLHIHHIARYTTDPAWPAPVWGRVESKPYSQETANNIITQFQDKLSG